MDNAGVCQSSAVGAFVSEQFRISPETAATVVVSTVCIYLAFIVLVRLVGPRSLSGVSSFDFACVVAFGAVLGRTVLLTDPTLMIGLVALASFFAMQGLLGVLRQSRRLDRWINRPPTMLVDEGVLLHDNMRRAHIVDDEVRYALRRHGARSLQDVRCVVLERNGSLTVILSDDGLDPWLLEDVTAQAAGRS